MSRVLQAVVCVFLLYTVDTVSAQRVDVDIEVPGNSCGRCAVCWQIRSALISYSTYDSHARKTYYHTHHPCDVPCDSNSRLLEVYQCYYTDPYKCTSQETQCWYQRQVHILSGTKSTSCRNDVNFTNSPFTGAKGDPSSEDPRLRISYSKGAYTFTCTENYNLGTKWRKVGNTTIRVPRCFKPTNTNPLASTTKSLTTFSSRKGKMLSYASTPDILNSTTVANGTTLIDTRVPPSTSSPSYTSSTQISSISDKSYIGSAPSHSTLAMTGMLMLGLVLGAMLALCTCKIRNKMRRNGPASSQPTTDLADLEAAPNSQPSATPLLTVDQSTDSQNEEALNSQPAVLYDEAIPESQEYEEIELNTMLPAFSQSVVGPSTVTQGESTSSQPAVLYDEAIPESQEYEEIQLNKDQPYSPQPVMNQSTETRVQGTPSSVLYDDAIPESQEYEEIKLNMQYSNVGEINQNQTQSKPAEYLDIVA